MTAESSEASPTRCHGCARHPSTCWIMPCLVLEVALASGPRAVFAWGQKSGVEIRPQEDFRLPKDRGIVPIAGAPRVHTARGGRAFVTRDTDQLFYVWRIDDADGPYWLYAYRKKTPALAKARQLGRMERKARASVACICGASPIVTAPGDDGLERCVACGCH